MIEGFRQLFLGEEHVCPWWFAYAFDNPVRWLIHRPERIFDGLVSEGQTVIDIGCGLGYFSLGLARMVGKSGRVIAVDLQEEMLERTRQRAARAGLADRIELRQARAERMGIAEKVSFALAFWMAHEVPDKAAFFREVLDILRLDAHFLLVEPKIHVSASQFDRTVEVAAMAGLKRCRTPRIGASRAALFVP